MAGPRTRGLLDDVRRAAGDARIDLVQLPWSDQVSAVLDGRVDAALVRPPLPGGAVRRIPLLSERRVLVMSAGHPLARHRTLTAADLVDTTQVDSVGVYEPWRRFWTLDPRPDGTRARFGAVVHAVEEMLEVCAATDVVGITAESVADLYPRQDLVHRPIVDIEPSTVELLVPTSPSGHLTDLLAATAARHYASDDAGRESCTG